MAQQMNVNPTDDLQFIDADSEYHKETSTYEEIVVKQIQRCVDILSKEVIGGTLKTRISKGGQTEQYVEDVRELIVNSVGTLRILMLPFLKKPEIEKIDEVKDTIKEAKDKLGEAKQLVPGRGYVEVKNIQFLDTSHPIWKRYTEMRAEMYREIFEIIVLAYHRDKAELEALSVEG